MQAANILRCCSASFAEVSPRRIFKRCRRLSALLLAASLAATAQTNQANAKLNPPALPDASSRATLHGSLTYHLRNMFGHPLAGISVEVRNAQTHSIVRSATTGREGTAAFQDLPVGRYEVTLAGGILPPRREVQLDARDNQLTASLPLSPPSARAREVVSVQQLTIPHRAREALDAATVAWQKYDWKKAREQASRALAMHPHYAAALSLLGYLDVQSGNLKNACAELEQAIAYDPSSAFAYLTLGAAYNSLKRYDAALQALSVFPSVSDDKWQLHYEIARSYLGMHDYEAGLREIDYSLKIAQPSPAVLHLAKAHALLGLHRSPEATAELETMLREDPKSPFVPDAQNLLAVIRAHASQ